MKELDTQLLQERLEEYIDIYALFLSKQLHHFKYYLK